MLKIRPFLLVHSLLFTLLFTSNFNLYAQEKVIVGYGGLGTAGQEKNYPTYKRINKKHPFTLARAVHNAIEKVADDLPFQILLESDTEKMKRHIDHPYSLAVAITRDDIVREQFTTPTSEINKTIVNVGMVIILYQTVSDSNNSEHKRNTVLFSLPLVGYFQQLDGKKQLTEEEIDKLFISTTTKTIEDHLVKRLKEIHLERITGSVISSNSGSVTVNFGALQGVEKDNKVDFLDDKGRKKGKGTIIALNNSECTVKLDGKFKVSGGDQVVGNICKGLSEDTYQVASFKVSSKKAAIMFEEKKLGQQVAQWFSDFLVSRSGKAVLPSKLNGEWVTTATGESSMLFVQDGRRQIFDVHPPKYSVHLDLSGIKSAKIDSNNINEIWAFKAWLNVDIPDRKFSKKFDEVASKNLVRGFQQYSEADEYFDLIHQLTAKAAMEESL